MCTPVYITFFHNPNPSPILRHKGYLFDDPFPFYTTQGTGYPSDTPSRLHHTGYPLIPPIVYTTPGTTLITPSSLHHAEYPFDDPPPPPFYTTQGTPLMTPSRLHDSWYPFDTPSGLHHSWYPFADLWHQGYTYGCKRPSNLFILTNNIIAFG